MRRESYGTEIESTDVDQDLIRPASGWDGARGAAPAFGRMYRSRGDRSAPPAPGDTGSIIGRSGGSGYRGARPWFGAEDGEAEPDPWADFGADHEASVRMGPFEYHGPQLGGVVLGLSAFLLLWKMGSR